MAQDLADLLQGKTKILILPHLCYNWEQLVRVPFFAKGGS